MQPRSGGAFTRGDVHAFLVAAGRAAQTVSPDTRITVDSAVAYIAKEMTGPDPEWDVLRRWGVLAKRELALEAHPLVMLPLLDMPWP